MTRFINLSHLRGNKKLQIYINVTARNKKLNQFHTLLITNKKGMNFKICT